MVLPVEPFTKKTRSGGGLAPGASVISLTLLAVAETRGTVTLPAIEIVLGAEDGAVLHDIAWPAHVVELDTAGDGADQALRPRQDTDGVERHALRAVQFDARPARGIDRDVPEASAGAVLLKDGRTAAPGRHDEDVARLDDPLGFARAAERDAVWMGRVERRKGHQQRPRRILILRQTITRVEALEQEGLELPRYPRLVPVELVNIRPVRLRHGNDLFPGDLRDV